MFQKRPHSAPTLIPQKTDGSYCVKQVQSSFNEVKRPLKDFTLCPWTTSPTQQNTQHKQKESKKSRDQNTKSSPALTTSMRDVTNRYSKPPVPPTQNRTKVGGKWNARSFCTGGGKGHMTTSTSCGFQHYTDTTRYMSVYRQEKMSRLHEEFADDIQNILNYQSSVLPDEPPTIYTLKTNAGTTFYQSLLHQQLNEAQDNSSIAYRVEASKQHEDKFRKQQKTKARGSDFDDEQKRKNVEQKPNKGRKQKTLNHILFPKCESVFLPAKPPVSTTTNNSNDGTATANMFLSDHPLQCRRFTELTVQKASQHHGIPSSNHGLPNSSCTNKFVATNCPTFSSVDNGHWKASHSYSLYQYDDSYQQHKEKVKLRSAEERKRLHLKQQQNLLCGSSLAFPNSKTGMSEFMSVNYSNKISLINRNDKQNNEYNRIIKRVLENYDPSPNQVRARLTSRHNESQPSKHEPITLLAIN